MGYGKSSERVRQGGRTRLPIEMDEQELNELFAGCLPRLYSAARKILNTREESEDALQDALLLAYKKLHQFQGRSSFATWLYSIVRNTAKGHYRYSKTHPMYSTDHESFGKDGEPAENAFTDTKPDPEEGYAVLEKARFIGNTANALPRKYAAAIDQFYSKELGEVEAAQNLGITVAALKARLFRGRVMLARRIRQHGGYVNEVEFKSRCAVTRRRISCDGGRHKRPLRTSHSSMLSYSIGG